MVPDILAKLILKGDAKFKTYSNGGSGVSSIPYPKNAAKMYVVSMLWNPFDDGYDNPTVKDDPYRLALRTIHTHILDTGEDQHIINLRDNLYRSFNNDLPVTGELPLLPPPTVVPLLIESTQDIHCRTYCFAPPTGTTGQFTNVPASTQERRSPNGYVPGAFGFDAVRVTETASGARIINMGGNTDPDVLVRGNLRQKDQFFDEVTNLTRLNDQITGNIALRGQYQYPLITYGIVIVNKLPTIYSF